MIKNYDDIKKITAEILSVGIDHCIRLEDFAGLSSLEVHPHIDYMLKCVFFQFRAYLAANKTHLEPIKSTKYPANWWEAFKLEFFPSWLLEKYPVCYTTITTEIQHIHMCPHIQTQPQKKHIEWLMYEPKPKS